MSGYKYVRVKFSGKMYVSFSGRVNLRMVCGVGLLKNKFDFGPNFSNNISIYLPVYACHSHLELRASVKHLFHFSFLILDSR
jgi:hypothetical protein